MYDRKTGEELNKGVLGMGRNGPAGRRRNFSEKRRVMARDERNVDHTRDWAVTVRELQR